MVVDVDEAGARRLGVPLGSPARGTALTRILALKGSPGWLVDAASIREWRFQGITERAGAAILYGPWVDARTLADVIRLPLREGLPLLSRLASAILLLRERMVPLFPIQTDAVLFTSPGPILFLPPETMRELRGLRTFEENQETFDALSNPDLRGEGMISFAIAALLFRIITGTFPFTGRTPEDLHEQMRKLQINEPGRAVPGLRAEISAAVMAGLGRAQAGERKRPAPPSLEEWDDFLRAWQAVEPVLALTKEETQSILSSAAASSQSSEKKFRRRMFWEKNWKTALIIAGVVVLVGAGAGSILTRALAPRVTRGYPPRKVVETFYTGMNRLDHMAMSACVVGKAGQGEINEAMNLYVISRVSTGYEGRSTIVGADEWDRAGRPALGGSRSVYGVTGLSITAEQGEPQPVFLVTYEKWTPTPGGGDSASPGGTSGGASGAPSGSAAAAPRFQGSAVTDRIFMKKDRGDWVIYRIDRLRSEAIATP
ncbi:MAG TPA: hypothetical protein VMV03_00310 [Spirochaetia bacterium]|nr:hypothetical protein [Spirochaetia bacterium]